MPIDINGYKLSNSATNLVFGLSGTMVGAAANGIKDPMLPGAWGSAQAGGSTYNIYPFPVNGTTVNTGSPWNTSTYLFTCPVAGIYYISFGGIVGLGSGASYGYFAIIVNGTNNYFSYKNTDNNWELHHQEVMIKLQAGDAISWAMNVSPGPNGGTACGAYQANHNMITIWLIG